MAGIDRASHDLPTSMAWQVVFRYRRTFEMRAMHVAIQAVRSLIAFSIMSGSFMVWQR
jgi:hypothetical protein